jgi:hypothetical protein
MRTAGDGFEETGGARAVSVMGALLALVEQRVEK